MTATFTVMSRSSTSCVVVMRLTIMCIINTVKLTPRRTAVTGDYEPSALDWVREHVEQIMRTGTTDGVTMRGLPTVLMTYRGARTGKVRKTPVMRVEHEGRYVAVAS